MVLDTVHTMRIVRYFWAAQIQTNSSFHKMAPMYSGQLLGHMICILSQSKTTERISGYSPEWATSLYRLWNFFRLPALQWYSMLVFSLQLRSLTTGDSFCLTWRATVANTMCFVSLAVLLSLNIRTFQSLSWGSLVSINRSFQNITAYLPFWLFLWKRRFMLGVYSASWISLYNLNYSHHVLQVTPHWSLATGWPLFLKRFWSTLLIEHEKQLSLSMLFASVPPFIMFEVNLPFPFVCTVSDKNKSNQVILLSSFPYIFFAFSLITFGNVIQNKHESL